VRFVLVHLPHILPALFAFGFLLRFGLYASRLPPAHLDDAQLAEWRRANEARQRPKRGVSRRVSRLGIAALPLLVAGFGTGLVAYTFDLNGDRPSAALIWSHVATSSLGLALVAMKLFRLPPGALRRGADPHNAAREGSSLALVALSVPLLVTGVVLLVDPGTDSFSAYLHLISGVWWTLFVQWHLYRYFSRALRATFRARATRAAAGAGR